MLNDVEAAFRTLKTDLGLRPIYHQKTDRISGLSTHYRVTTTLKQKDNKTLHIRKSTQANPQQKAIYQACNIVSAKPNTIISSY